MPPINMRNLPQIEEGLNNLETRMRAIMATKDATTSKIQTSMLSISVLIKQLQGCGQLKKQIEELKQYIAQLESEAAISQTNVDELNSRIKASYDTLSALIAEYEKKNAEFNEFAPAQFEQIQRDLESILQETPNQGSSSSSSSLNNGPTPKDNATLELLPEYSEFNTPEEYMTDVKGIIDTNKDLRYLFAQLDPSSYKQYEYFKRNNLFPPDRLEELKNYAVSQQGGRRRRSSKKCKKGGYHYSSKNSLTKKVKKHKHRSKSRNSRTSRSSRSSSSKTNSDDSKSSGL
jgi:hypothetical protein